MAYAGWTAVIQDDRGNIQPGATVEVRNINTGSLAVLYADRMGTVGLGNPFQADSEGYATFYAKGAEYRITAIRGPWTTEWPYVAVGTTQGVDLSDLALGLDYDAQVNTLPERDAYDGEPEGFSVLVSDVGDGRGAVYTRTDVPGEWSDPAFITGTPGPATNISIGTVDTVDYGEGSSATMTGASPAQVLNLELERGAPGRIENFQGPWSGSVTYASGDIVESGGSLYMAMVADPAAVPPSTGWELFLPGSSVADGAVTIAKTDGTYARVTFDTVAQLLTGVVAGKTLGYSTGLIVSPGEIVYAQGFRYEVAASGATDAHVETAGGVKLYVLPDTENSISTAQFGIQDATPGSVTQAAFEAAVIAARENGYRLISPEGSDIRLIDTVNVRAVHLDLRGRIYGENLVPVLVMGGYNTIRNNPEQRVFEVSNGLDRDNPAIQVKGFRGSVMHIRRCLSVQLYADSDSSEGGQEAVTGGNSVSIAYNHFFFVDVHALELTNNPDTDGTTTQWINANTFFCRRLSRLRINGTYSHNDNTFITPNFEGAGAEIDIENGSMNKIHDARFENLGPAPIVKFGPTSRRNIITYSWMPTLEDLRIPDSFWRNGYVEIAQPEGEIGNGNVVKNTLLANETRHRIFEFSTGSCMVLSNDNGTVSACDMAIMSVGVSGLNTVSRASSSIIARIPDYIPFPPNARLQVYGDGGNNFRCNVQFFDANHDLITSEPDFYSGGGTTWNAGTSTLAQSGNNGQYGLLNADPGVAFIKLTIISNNTNARFSNLAAYVYTDGPELVDTLSQWDMGKRSAGLVFSGTAPTRGLPQHGQIVGIRSGGYHQCTFRNSLETTSPASSGAGSISVPSGHGASNGDVIGIEYDGDNAHWTTVSGTSGTSISLTNNLPANITAGARVELVRWVTNT